MDEVLTRSEMEHFDPKDIKTLKKKVAQAINGRLRIREIGNGQSQENQYYQPKSTQYVAFFLDESQIE
jgi:hypothetical protein